MLKNRSRSIGCHSIFFQCSLSAAEQLNRSRNDPLISDHLITQNRDACYVAFDLLRVPRRFSHPVLAHSISFRDSDAEDYHRMYFGSGLLTRRSPELTGRCGFEVWALQRMPVTAVSPKFHCQWVSNKLTIIAHCSRG